MDNELELDRLFAEARAAMRHEVKVRKARVPTQVQLSAEERLRAELAPLENWVKQRGIALVHQETRTLIGTFIEYTHPKAPGARRLVREYHELPVEATEEVAGEWVHVPPQPPAKHHIWHASRPVLMDCVLGRMHVSKANVELLARFGEGSLDRVELQNDTTFISPTTPEIVILAAGTNILPEMSQSSINNLLKILYD